MIDIQHHLLTRLAPGQAKKAVSQFLTRTVVPESVRSGEIPSPACIDLESLPPEDRTLEQMVRALEPDVAGRSGQIPWTQRNALIDVLTPALKTLERTYPTPAHRAFCRLVPVTDYLSKTFVNGLDGLTLQQVHEHGEYPKITERMITAEIETGAVQTFGLILSLTRETLANDTASQFFGSAANALTGAAYRHEAGQVYGLLESGATLADGQPWFDASNSVSQASILGALTAGFELFAGQQFASGEFTDAQPGVLVIPASWSIIASDIVSDILLSVGAGQLQVVKSGRISSGYIFANPVACPSIGLAGFLGVRPQLELNNRLRLESNDGLQLKVRHEYCPIPLSRVGIVKMTSAS